MVGSKGDLYLRSFLQLFISLPSRLLGFSLGTYFATREVPAFCMTPFLTFAAGRIILNAEPAWKRALFVSNCLGSWCLSDERWLNGLW